MSELTILTSVHHNRLIPFSERDAIKNNLPLLTRSFVSTQIKNWLYPRYCQSTGLLQSIIPPKYVAAYQSASDIEMLAMVAYLYKAHGLESTVLVSDPDNEWGSESFVLADDSDLSYGCSKVASPVYTVIPNFVGTLSQVLKLWAAMPCDGALDVSHGSSWFIHISSPLRVVARTKKNCRQVDSFIDSLIRFCNECNNVAISHRRQINT